MSLYILSISAAKEGSGGGKQQQPLSTSEFYHLSPNSTSTTIYASTSQNLKTSPTQNSNSVILSYDDVGVSCDRMSQKPWKHDKWYHARWNDFIVIIISYLLPRSHIFRICATPRHATSLKYMSYNKYYPNPGNRGGGEDNVIHCLKMRDISYSMKIFK